MWTINSESVEAGEGEAMCVLRGSTASRAVATPTPSFSRSPTPASSRARMASQLFTACVSGSTRA